MPSITHSLAEDLLRIQFSTDDDIDESIEVLDCVVVSFDALDKIVAIEIKNASQNTILDGFDGEQPVLVDNSTPAREVYTIGELAAKFRISPRALQKSIQKMRQDGHNIGVRGGAAMGKRTTILSESDAEQIRKWRLSHPPGRPRYS